MKKYLAVAKITVAAIVQFRTNFLIGGFRQFILLLTLYSIWLTVFAKNQSFFGFDKSQILTYVLISGLLRPLTLDSRTDQISSEISHETKLFSHLLRPIGFFKYYFTLDLVNKAFVLFFAAINIALLIVIFKTLPILPSGPNAVFFLISVVLAIFVYFYLSTLISLVAFWTFEVWGLRFASTLLMEFAAGAFFPLSVLPQVFQIAVSFTPFPYLIYYPAQIYLGKVASGQIFVILTVLIFWLLLLFLTVNFVWKKGLKVYVAEGA